MGKEPKFVFWATLGKNESGELIEQAATTFIITLKLKIN